MSKYTHQQTFSNRNPSASGLNRSRKVTGVVNDDPTSGISMSRRNLITEQKSVPELMQFISQARTGDNLDVFSYHSPIILKSGILIRT